MGKVRIKKSTPTENPPTGYTDLFVDDVDNLTKVRKEDGTTAILEGTDILVGATATDASPGFLDDKLAAGPGTTKQVLNSGANEQIQITADVTTVHGRIGDVVGESGDYSADQIDYDNSSSGLTATNTQDALDELKTLSDASDEALEISYDNSTSGLAATNVQDAIDEVEARVDTIESEQVTQNNDIVQNTADIAQEILDRTNADAALQSQITSNDADIAQNTADIAQEIVDRTNADANLQSQIDAHLDGGPSKHDSTEIDYERADGSKIDIQAASDNVETAITDLDDRKLSVNGSNTMAADLDMGGNSLVNVNNVDGRVVSADGSKLDTIETNAKDDQDANEVPYDDTNTSLGVAEVQAAIEALNTKFTKEYFQANQQTFQNNITTAVNLVNDVESQNSNTSVFSYNTSTGVLTINKDSDFKFTWTITNDTVDNSRQTGLLRFQRFNGVSFVDIPSVEGQSLAYTYNRNNASGETTASITCVLSVTSGQQFRATIECTTNNAVRTVALGTSLVVEEK
jgi:hypothetical protein